VRGRTARCLARAVALALLLASAPFARAAVVLDSFRQGSASNTNDLDTTVLTVGNTSNRLVLVAVSLANPAVSVLSVTWRGLSAQRVYSQATGQLGKGCRTEVWQLVDPPPGAATTDVRLSAATALGVGLAVYSGVDAQHPVGARAMISGTTSPIVVSQAVPSGQPAVAVVCLGGTWTGELDAPAAVASPADTVLWDLSEPGLVGLASQRVAGNNNTATVRWDLGGGSAFVWQGMMFSVNPAAPEDAGVDAGPDVGADVARDLAPDLAPDRAPDLRVPDDLPADLTSVPDLAPLLDLAPSPDLGGEPTLESPPDAGSAEPDAHVAPAPGPDAAGAQEPDADSFRDVHFQIGCACRVGAPDGGATVLFVSVVAVLALRRRRR
jgi:MYXO-CTERM domain-containing protein